MALNRVRLADIQEIAAAAAALITNASGDKTWIRGILIHNGNAGAETVKLYNVPDSTGSVGTAADANKFFEEAIPTLENRYIDLPGPGILLTDTNDTIQGVTTTATKTTIQFFGDTETP